MSDTNGHTNPFSFNKYERNAIVGEWVYYFPSGSRQEVPSIALVVSAYGMTVGLRAPGEAKFRAYRTIRHIDDPYWDGRGATLAKHGAWDFHECYGEVFTHQINKRARELERLARIKEHQSSMPPAEFEALVALEQHGPVMNRIVKDTGMTVAELNNLPTFMEKFKAAKVEKWEEKQQRSVASTEGWEKKRTEKEEAEAETASA